MTKGIVFIAENNEELDYVKMAKANSLMAKTYLNVPVALITNEETTDTDLGDFFDEVIVTRKQTEEQMKYYFGYGKRSFLSWNNRNRTKVYDLTPFDQTLLLDVDYLVMDNSLNAVWDNIEPILMNRETKTPLMQDLHLSDRVLQDTTIPLYWATAVYFRKPEAASFFKLTKSIQENFIYFCRRYHTRTGLYRNDFVFSIAAHTIGDFQNTIKPLPNPILLTSLAADKIMKVRKGSIEILSKDRDWHYPVHVSQNIHYMNKFDLNDYTEKLIDLYI